jgi:flagellar protein FlaG
MAVSNAAVQALIREKSSDSAAAEARAAKPVEPVAVDLSGVTGVKPVGGVDSSASVESIKAELRESVKLANERLSTRGQRVEIGVDNNTGTIVVKVSDVNTGEMVRQIPSEDMLRITRNIDALTGILVDHKE